MTASKRPRSRPRRGGALATVAALSLSLVGAVGAASAATLPVVDDFESGLPAGVAAGGAAIGFNTFNDPNSTVSITTEVPDPQVPGAAAANKALRVDVTVVSYAGLAHTFENADMNAWVTQDWSTFEGFQFELLGQGSGTSLFIDVIDNRNPGSTKDDAERWTAAFVDDVAGWRTVQIPFDAMARKEIGNGAPNDGFGLTEVHGWAFGSITTDGPEVFHLDDVSVYGVAPERPLTVGFATVDTQVIEGDPATVGLKLSKPSAETVTVDWATTTGTARPDRDYVPESGTVTFAPNQTLASIQVETIDDTKYQGERGVVVELSNPTVASLGRPPLTRVLVLDDETFDPNLVTDFEAGAYLWSTSPNATITTAEIVAGDALEVPGQGAFEQVASVTRPGNGTVTARHEFAQAQDWSDTQAVSLLYYGRGTGRTVDVTLENNRTVAADADPSTWKLAWRDEFNTRAGTAPDPQTWTHEIGDGTIIGKPGWGNDELQYYTDSTENAATDGQGNMVITTRATDPDTAPLCYYGPCDYTSARLVTQNKVELQYGRIESRVQVPRGSGLWPAFWALGADINRNPWPQSGEIDIMENVGREPYTVFGTIHGPGYSGGQSFGGTWDFDVPVADAFHTFAVEWEPGEIRWSVDGIQFHEAAPADVDPNEWVFEHPFFLLMNVAIGGNFGGTVGSDTVFPQTMKVDYVRVYQPVERPIPFTARFTDDTTGWREVFLPIVDFAGRPGTTLDVTDVRSLTVTAPATRGKPMLLDQVRLIPKPAPTEIVVTNLGNSGPGSLREALADIAVDGTITFDPALAGGTIPLSGGPLVADRSVTVDGSGAPGLAVDGGGAVRVLEVAAGAVVAVSELTLTNGYGFELAGAVLNNGSLTLDRVVVSDSNVTTGGIDFWKGGAGIYTGDSGVLVLRDSTVRDNTVVGGAGGGVYGFFGSDVTIERSTITGNTVNDVGGGVRSLGDTLITNSTISGNTATGWHGGGVFHTDGAMTISYSTVTANTSPAGTAGGLFMGSFNPTPVTTPTAALQASIVADNSGDECIVFYGGPFAMESLGFNVLGDATCGAPAATDQVVADALLGPLADNGGPTLTHALLPGSPAIDTAEAASAPATDQRGITRPQGAGPDVGAFELN